MLLSTEPVANPTLTIMHSSHTVGPTRSCAGQPVQNKSMTPPGFPDKAPDRDPGSLSGLEERSCPEYVSTGRCSRLSSVEGKHVSTARMDSEPQEVRNDDPKQAEQQSGRFKAYTISPRARDNEITIVSRIPTFSASELAGVRHEKQAVSELSSRLCRTLMKS